MWAIQKIQYYCLVDICIYHITNMSEETNAIVIDVGNFMTRAGFGSSEEPQFITRSVVGTKNGQTYIGNKVCESPGLYDIKHVFDKGPLNSISTNFDIMTEIWENVFHNLKADPTQYKVLICVPPLYIKKDMEKSIEIMFETFKVPYYTSADTSSLSLYSSGRTEGIVLESGDLFTSFVPIVNNYLQYGSITRIPFAGNETTYCLSRLLMYQGFNFHTFKDMEVLRKIKEEHCFVAKDSNDISKENIECTIQDKIANLSRELSSCPEVLFNPGFSGLEYDGFSKMLFDTINKINEDNRKDLYVNIVLSGGNTMFKGFPERIENDIEKLAPPTMKVKCVAPPERLNAAWIGGSIVTQLAPFKDFCISKDEYYDAGPGLIHRKNVCTCNH